MDMPKRAQSQIKSTAIEDIIIDRQLYGPLPKLKSEKPLKSRHSTYNSPKLLGSLSSVPSPIFTPTFSQQNSLHLFHDQKQATETKKEKLLPHNEKLSDLKEENQNTTKLYQNQNQFNFNIEEDEEEDITFPHILLAQQTMGKSIIATRENYEHLNDLLHRLTAASKSDVTLSKKERLEKQKEAYDTVFSEVVRQAFFECGAKGEILQNVRDYMLDSASQIPILSDRLEKQKDSLKRALEDLVIQKKEFTTKIEVLEADKEKLVQ